MPSQRLATRLLIAALALPLASSCSGLTKALTRPFSKGEVGLTLVDELEERIERVHVDAEASKVELHELLGAFDTLQSEESFADPMAAHARCLATTEASTRKAGDLRDSVESMEDAAKPFFSRWRKQLDEFVSADLRERSRERMDATRARYDAIVNALLPALDDFEELNRRAADLAVFLGQDYNAGSLSAIESDVRVMNDRAAHLFIRFDDCLIACEEYVHAAALPGEQAGEEQPEELPEEPLEPAAE